MKKLKALKNSGKKAWVRGNEAMEIHIFCMWKEEEGVITLA